MNKLQVEIDEENETLTELYDEKNKAEEKKQKAAIEALLVSSFGKTYFWKHQTLDVTLPTTRIVLVPVLIESDKCISAKWIQFQILWLGQLSFSNFFCSTLVTKCWTSFDNGHLHLTFQAKSGERRQALAMLMLQYCAGYQSCVEAEELDSYRLWKIATIQVNL